MPTLYIVATPIGNLEDISLRALRTLREVKLIAAEDTRRTRLLLKAYDIKTPMTSYHEHNERTKVDYILNCLEDGDIALVSDAGMPGISDPGHELITTAIQRGIPVVPVPGPSSVITALSVSGLPTDRFAYIGFLPRKANERRLKLTSISRETCTIIILEAPHRLIRSLSDILSVLGDRKIAVCRELTKIHEEIFRGTVTEAIDHFAEQRGEFTLVIEGEIEKLKPTMTEEIGLQLRHMRLSGKKAKEAVASVAAETGLSKRDLYQAWLKSARGSDNE